MVVHSVYVQIEELRTLRVRANRGTENTKVADYMINQRGSHSCPFIYGRSVHNQRIECLWRDLFTGYTTVFYNLF